MNYKVKIEGFSNKVYYDTTIEDILKEIKIFTDLKYIKSIECINYQIKELSQYLVNLDENE